MSSRPPRLQFTSVGRTDIGLVRTLNEDRFVDRPSIGLWAVADGMGGHRAGDVASGMLAETLAQVETFGSGYAFLDNVTDAVQRVNRALIAHAAIAAPGAVIGSTVVVLIAYAGYYACLWAGDSRAYLVRGAKIEQITRDHSMVQELIDSGTIGRGEAKTHGRANVITRAVGVSDRLALDTHQGAIHDGDIFLLCSDGLTGLVEDREIAAHLADHSLEEAADALIALTLTRGAKDNVTLVIVRAEVGSDDTLDPREPNWF